SDRSHVELKCLRARERSAMRALRLAHELRLELHRAEPFDAAVDVVVALDEPDAFDLRADLERRRRALDLEVLDDRDGIAVLKAVAVRVEHDEPFRRRVVRVSRGCRGDRPLMRALRTDVEETVLVHERGLAFRAGRYLTHEIRL